MGDTLKEQAKQAIIEKVNKNLEDFFDYFSQQTDVDDYTFRFYGVLKCETEFLFFVNGTWATMQVCWDDAELRSDLDFILYGVQAVIYDDEKIAEFSYEKI